MSVRGKPTPVMYMVNVNGKRVTGIAENQSKALADLHALGLTEWESAEQLRAAKGSSRSASKEFDAAVKTKSRGNGAWHPITHESYKAALERREKLGMGHFS